MTAERETVLSRLRSNETSGMECVRELSYLMDRELASMAANILPSHISLAAIGGYGRQELCPHSDVDIMFVLPRNCSDCSSEIEKFLYALWDAGIKVGHATRTIRDCLTIARSDMAALTSMLDIRHIYGPEDLTGELKTALNKDRNNRRKNKYVKDKLDERDLRHKRLGDSRYVLEPDIKDGKGGLRDFQTLFWITEVLFDARTPNDLADLNILTRREARSFSRSFEYLLTVRCHLHDLAGRPEERLHFDVQPALARRLGYRERSNAKAVERFMKHYFLVTRDVGNLTRIVCSAIEASRNGKNEKPKTGYGFQIKSGRLDFPGESSLRNNPCEMIRIFRTAQEKNLDIHPFALRRITKNLVLIDDSFRNDRTANRIFMEILTGKSAARTLRRMNEAGVLGRFIPQFGRIIALTQFDRYHTFTVDEHTLRAIDVLEKLENRGLREEAPAASKVISEVKDRKILFTAMFLHDICKGRGGNHSLLGAELALTLCPRLGLDDTQTRIVSWLVFDHLVMSSIAFKRDTEDPKTINDFAFRVYDRERLRLLFVLTAADIIAVGPGRWTAWKSKLLEELYSKASDAIKGHGSFQENKTRAPENYVAGQTIIDFASSPEHDATFVTICTSDKPGLFATIAGGLSAAGANIIEARINTLEDGTAVDTFLIQNLSGKAFNNNWRQKSLRDSVRKAIDGNLEIKPAIEKHAGSPLKKEKIFNIETKVNVENHASHTDTVIEISARDRPGLLFDLTCTLRDHKLTVRSAKITTHGIKAIDVFYVQDKQGRKLKDKNKILSLISCIKEASADNLK